MAWLQDWHSELGPTMQALVQATWQASVLVVLVLAMQMLFGRWLSARWRYALWSVVVLRLMLPVTPGSVVSVFNLFRGEAETVVVAELPAATVFEPLNMEAVDLSGWEPVASAAGEQVYEPVSQRHAAGVVLVVWLIGVVLVLGLLLLINTVLALRLRRYTSVTDEGLLALLESCKREMALCRNVRLLVIPKLASPALAGMFRPKLLVPAALVDEMPKEELRFVLLHELAHMKKHDIAMNWLLILLAAVHWFNPLVWFAFARLRADRELARDAMVLHATGTDASQAYGQTIIRVLEQLTRPRLANPALAGIGDGMGQLKRRIRMIALSPKRRPALTVVGGMLLATLATIGLTDAAEPSEPAGTSESVVQNDADIDQPPNFVGTWKTPEGTADPVTIVFVDDREVTIIDEPNLVATYRYRVEGEHLLMTRGDERLEFIYQFVGKSLLLTFQDRTTEFVRTVPDEVEEGNRFEAPDVRQNLRQMMNVGLAARIYAANHEERMPPNLGTTLSYVDRNSEWTDDDDRPATLQEKARMYLTPADQEAIEVPGEPTPEWITEHTSYVYLGSEDLRWSDIPEDVLMMTVLLHEKLDEQEQKEDRVVGLIFFDSHGEAAEPDVAERLIEESKSVIEKAVAAKKQHVLSPAETEIYARWHQLEASSVHEQSRPASVQYVFTHTVVYGDANHPDMNATGEMNYKQSGDKYYVSYSQNGVRISGYPTNPDRSVKPETYTLYAEQAFDGNVLRMRGTGSEQMLFQTRSSRAWPIPTPLPWDVLGLNSPARLEKLLEEGRIRLVSIAEEPGATGPLTRVTFEYVDEETVAVETWYDSARGNIVVKANRYSPTTGEVYYYVRDVKVEEFEVNGKEYFLPVAGVKQMLKDGKVISSQTFSVDIDSVRFDKSIEDHVFRLTPKPGEQVYDSDMNKLVTE